MNNFMPTGASGIQPVYIVFEAGPTHYGLNSALKLIDVAADAGANAIKFQIIDVEKLIPDPTVMFTYHALKDKETGETEKVVESLKGILKRRELSIEEWTQVINHAKRKKIDFFSTATNQSELEFLFKMGTSSVKIASADINYHYFLRLAAKYSWAVQIDTGQATIAEVENAVAVLEDAGCAKIIINHCPSGYPAKNDGINLRMLTTLKQMFPYPVAFSDHSHGATMDIAAVALGAQIIEKTITLDRTIRSPEHIMSLEPDEAAGFVQTIRNVELALGTTRKTINAEEVIARTPGRRSIIAGQNLPKGTTIKQMHLEYTRPGTGIAPNLDYLILGQVTSVDVRKGEQFHWNMF